MPQALKDARHLQTLSSVFIRYHQLSQHFCTSLGGFRNTFIVFFGLWWWGLSSAASSPVFWTSGHFIPPLLLYYWEISILHRPHSSEQDTHSSYVSLGHQDLTFKPNVSDMNLKPSIWELNTKQWLLWSCCSHPPHGSAGGRWAVIGVIGVIKVIRRNLVILTNLTCSQ